MKFDQTKLLPQALEKIKEVNDEAGYRKYLEVPEMVRIICECVEANYNVIPKEIMNSMITAKQARQIVRESLIPDLAELEVQIESAAKKGFRFISLSEGTWHIKNRDYERTKSLVKILMESGYHIEYAGSRSIISW
jgi:hypothetical protein